MNKRIDKNSATAAMARFEGVIDARGLPPARVKLGNKNDTLFSVISSVPARNLTGVIWTLLRLQRS